MATRVFDTEADLIHHLHAGNSEAFSSVYNQLHQRLYFFALRFVQPSDAEDVTAESFIQFWNKKQDFNSMDGISAFLHVLVRNRCFNLLRDQRNRANKVTELLHLFEEIDDNDHLLEQVRVELVNLIYTQVDRLPAKMKEIFLLSYLKGLKPSQIAERLQISVQTVSNQKLNAIKLLKAALVQYHLLAALVLLLELEGRFTA